MAGRPENGRKRGIHVLKLMHAMSPNIHSGIVDMWDAVIPKLMQYIEGRILNHLTLIWEIMEFGPN